MELQCLVLQHGGGAFAVAVLDGISPHSLPVPSSTQPSAAVAGTDPVSAAHLLRRSP
ncbi:hypothetical protein [Streptomyces sp. SID10815]|uniref:hypothetical protein n=1 Tax=Streptomyces sp. SID10815 TaxID=2706027 RepID=UPI0013CB06B2|nr:hypothetical protein [Streptomyces sp. SID10815]NEA49878.1 hypothetical protein [Streptomyces sp. SID10815]